MADIKLGLKENWKQFSLLVLINAFVGGMVGLERSILPQIAEQEFHIAAKTAILSFIIVFGIVKALTNYFTGSLANRLGRKNLLIVGWIVGIPVPFLLMYAPDWNWIIAANVFLGINQGLTWSSTVVMKIDLVGEKNRGFAMGLNEFSGYIALAAVGFATGWIASEYGLRPYPFYIGIGLVAAGLLMSVLFIKDTANHSKQEGSVSQIPRLKNIFMETSWKNANLGSVTQAGLVNNLNDGMTWGLLPILLASTGFNLADISIITAIYPSVWGICQLFTGKLADMYSKKWLLFLGMFIQGITLLLLVWAVSFYDYAVLAIALGFGTALVYPTFLASIAENTHPSDRPKSVGTFRLWRDLGYAIGAVLTGIIADTFNINTAVVFIALLTILSSIIILVRMKDNANLNARSFLDKVVKQVG
jgi:MFS family permease